MYIELQFCRDFEGKIFGSHWLFGALLFYITRDSDNQSKLGQLELNIYSIFWNLLLTVENQHNTEARKVFLSFRVWANMLKSSKEADEKCTRFEPRLS